MSAALASSFCWSGSCSAGSTGLMLIVAFALAAVSGVQTTGG